MKDNNIIYCKRIEFDSSLKNGEIKRRILLGLIEKEDDYFIYFRTKNNIYTISKKAITTIQPTNIEFQEGDDSEH